MYSEIWTLAKVRDGFEKFYKLYNRYPTAYDVDDFDFLPSSRQIQRKFGGLVNLRKELGLNIENYSEGETRSNKVASFNIRGRKYENTIFNLLKEKFDEKFIHIEKPTIKDLSEKEYNSKDRYDFYVYAKPSNFAVDVFGTEDERGVLKIINIKEKKYKKADMSEDLYFVYFGNNVNKNKIDRWLDYKGSNFPSNWKILDSDDFKNELLKYSSFSAI